ncbi:MAG: flagellar hook-basal body protein [Candidatus Zixiibacteriota bacterium]
MIKGIYRSANGMLPRMERQDAIAHNIANAGTTGFKKNVMFVKELARAEGKVRPRKSDWEKSVASYIRVDHTPGVFDKTDNPLDLAIDGDGFFTLQTPEGATVLTRSGSFVVDNEGFLAFPGGFRLVGEGGPLQVGNGTLSVSQNGDVQSDGVSVGRIVPKTLADLDRLQRIGGSLFAVPEGEQLLPSLWATVRQGYLETSNVDIVGEMVDMIVAYREYEANARALQTQDTTLDHLMNKVAGKG